MTYVHSHSENVPEHKLELIVPCSVLLYHVGISGGGILQNISISSSVLQSSR